jgi:WD40 repeat protein/DNA-binding SARP family transcriptional activator
VVTRSSADGIGCTVDTALNFRLLGPLEVAGDDGVELSIGTGRQRALLGLLILRGNELVGSDRLVEDLWGHSPPPTAQRMLHNQVFTLRRALGRNGRLETHGSAYRLNVRPGERDIDRFEELLASGRAWMESDPERAAETLRQALGLWRGAALSDLAFESFAQPEIARLEERRWAAFEAWCEAELALGRHADLVAELEAAVADQPLRERLHGQLMLALYRCGRQAEALDAYRRARTTLVEEIGVEPTAELRELQAAILAQDPALAAPAAPNLPAGLAGGSPTLAGRTRELAELVSLLADACDGRGGLAFVAGPRGIGKTRLAQELARDALRRRMDVLYTGAGDPLSAGTQPEDRERPTLLIVDDADEAAGDVLARAAALTGSDARRRLLVLVLHRRPESPAIFDGQPAHRLALGPLGPDAVGEIAGLYGPLAIDALAAESGGVPLAVHRLAAEWARAQASDAIGVSAGRATTERDQLRSAEAELSEHLLHLQALDDRTRRLTADDPGSPVATVCPFLGLATFDAVHAEYFFGRERLVAALVARLVGSPLVAVIGPSGSGKSSAVRAGLLPALAAGVLPGSERWRQALMRPGPHPVAQLERALAEGDERALLVVDQFEEVFTVCRDDGERARFFDALVELAEDRERSVQVVVAMRADFFGHCAAHERLGRLAGASPVLVGAMRRDELRRAIEEPARRVGLTVEPSLTDAMIADVLDAPGGLPLLSAALLEQWRERDGPVMRHTVYERTGGVRGAVGRLAEETYARLSEPERRAARRILLRLADAREHEGGFVRRRVPRDELDAERDEHVANALAVLIDSRLVTADDGALEVAHEALLREWPRLRGWLEEDADGRRVHQQLTNAARDWQAGGRDSSELYRGARLAATLDWQAGHTDEPNEIERRFLDESRLEAEQEHEYQRRTNRRLRSLLAGAAALLVLAVVAGVVALDQRGDAREAALTADAQRLGAEARNQTSFDQAVRFARTAVALDDTPATRGDLLSVLQRMPATIGVVDHGAPMYGAAISPDGKLMAIGDDRGVVMVYDTATHLPLGRPYRFGTRLIQNVQFSPDGRTLAVSSFDENAPANHSGLLDLVDPRTGERRLHLRAPSVAGPAPFVYADVTFLPNRRDLLVRPVDGSGPAGQAAPVYRVDGATGAITDRLQVGEHTAGYNGSATPDGRRLFLTSRQDRRTWELDTERLRVVRSWPVGDAAGAVSPDGREFALGSLAGGVRLLDLTSGRVRPMQGGHRGEVTRLRFTPDGRRLVTAGHDGQVLLWDVERGSVAERFAGHRGEVDGLDLTADGRTLITASIDARAMLWDLAGDRRLERRFPVDTSFDIPSFTPRGIAVSPDGRTLALTRSDGMVDLIDAATLRRRAALHALDAAATAVAFSPDGRLLAVAGVSDRVTLWDARTLAPAGELPMPFSSDAIAFSRGGKLLAAAEEDVANPLNKGGPLHVWDVRRRSLTAFRGGSAANSIAFSPDGSLLAAAETESGTEVREAGTGRLVKRLSTGDFARSVAFSPDGGLLFVGRYDGRGDLFSTATWKPVGRPLEGHTARITSAQFTRDGSMLVTAGADGTAVVWDVKTQKPMGSPIRLAPNAFASAALSPDGSRLFAVSTRGDGIRFDLSPGDWNRHACLVAGRDLTAAEWADALPGRPRQAVCTGA